MKFASKLIHGGGQCTIAMNLWMHYTSAWFYLNAENIICWSTEEIKKKKETNKLGETLKAVLCTGLISIA